MPHLGLRVSEEFRATSRRGLLGDVMAEIDASVGRIHAALFDLGIAKNTLIVLASDNGPWIRFRETEEHPQYGEARRHVGYAMPFRDGKGSTWEGGMRSPGVFWWPGTIEAGRVEHAPASTLDLLPTLFHLADIDLPFDRMIDGRNIANYLNPEQYPGEVSEFFLPYPGANNLPKAVRQGPWKLHIQLISQLGTNHGFEANRENPLLFQVEHDISERFNRAEEEPAVVNALLQALVDYEESLKNDQIFWR